MNLEQKMWEELKKFDMNEPSHVLVKIHVQYIRINIHVLMLIKEYPNLRFIH